MSGSHPVASGSIPGIGFAYYCGGLAQVVERSIRIRQVGGSMPPTSNEDTKNRGRCDGVVNVSDSKSDPFGGAGSNPANVFCLFGLTGAMVARLPTEQEAVGSSPTLGCLLLLFLFS